MKCPACGIDGSGVHKSIDSGSSVLRRRKCLCGARWTTEEKTIRGSLVAFSGQETPNPGQGRTAEGQDLATGVPKGGLGVSDSGLIPARSGPFGASGSSGDLRSDRAKAKEPKYSADFVTFWSAYPRKTGKGAAWASWQKAGPQLADVLKALAWQRGTFEWRKDAGAFVPMPATYLNQRRWEDEPRGAPGTGPGAPPRHGMSVAEAEQRGIVARKEAEAVERSRQREAEQFKHGRDSDADALAPADWMNVAKGANG